MKYSTNTISLLSNNENIRDLGVSDCFLRTSPINACRTTQYIYIYVMLVACLTLIKEPNCARNGRTFSRCDDITVPSRLALHLHSWVDPVCCERMRTENKQHTRQDMYHYHCMFILYWVFSCFVFQFPSIENRTTTTIYILYIYIYVDSPRFHWLYMLMAGIGGWMMMMIWWSRNESGTYHIVSIMLYIYIYIHSNQCWIHYRIYTDSIQKARRHIAVSWNCTCCKTQSREWYSEASGFCMCVCVECWGAWKEWTRYSLGLLGGQVVNYCRTL